MASFHLLSEVICFLFAVLPTLWSRRECIVRSHRSSFWTFNILWLRSCWCCFLASSSRTMEDRIPGAPDGRTGYSIRLGISGMLRGKEEKQLRLSRDQGCVPNLKLMRILLLPIESFSRCTINKSMLMNLLKDHVLLSPFRIIVQPNRWAFRAIIILAHLY